MTYCWRRAGTESSLGFTEKRPRGSEIFFLIAGFVRFSSLSQGNRPKNRRVIELLSPFLPFLAPFIWLFSPPVQQFTGFSYHGRTAVSSVQGCALIFKLK